MKYGVYDDWKSKYTWRGVSAEGPMSSCVGGSVITRINDRGKLSGEGGGYSSRWNIYFRVTHRESEAIANEREK